MTKLLTGLEAQPKFPHVDLTDTNAAMLELMLANKSIVDAGHQASDSAHWLYRVAHPTITRLSPRIFPDLAQLEAIEHGVAMYETVASLVCANSQTSDVFAVNSLCHKMLVAKTTAFEAVTDQAVESLHRNTPLTMQVVEQAARRFYPSRTHYSVLGAALARDFEIQASKDSEDE